MHLPDLQPEEQVWSRLIEIRTLLLSFSCSFQTINLRDENTLTVNTARGWGNPQKK